MDESRWRTTWSQVAARLRLCSIFRNTEARGPNRILRKHCSEPWLLQTKESTIDGISVHSFMITQIENQASRNHQLMLFQGCLGLFFLIDK